MAGIEIRKMTALIQLLGLSRPLEIAQYPLVPCTDNLSIINCARLTHNLLQPDTCRLELAKIGRLFTTPSCPGVGIAAIHPKITPHEVPVISTVHHRQIEPAGKAVVGSYSTFPNPEWTKDPFVFLPLDASTNIAFEDALNKAKGLVRSFAVVVSPLPYFEFSRYFRERREHKLQIGLPELYRALDGKGPKKIQEIVEHFNQLAGQIRVEAFPWVGDLSPIEKLSDLKGKLYGVWFAGMNNGLGVFAQKLNGYYRSVVKELRVPQGLAGSVCRNWYEEACHSLKATERQIFQTK